MFVGNPPNWVNTLSVTTCCSLTPGCCVAEWTLRPLTRTQNLIESSDVSSARRPSVH